MLEAQEASEAKAKNKANPSPFELPHPNNPKRFYVVLNESIAPVAIYAGLAAVNRHLEEGVEWGKLAETAASTRGDVKAFQSLEEAVVYFYGRCGRRQICPLRR